MCVTVGPVGIEDETWPTTVVLQECPRPFPNVSEHLSRLFRHVFSVWRASGRGERVGSYRGSLSALLEFKNSPSSVNAESARVLNSLL